MDVRLCLGTVQQSHSLRHRAPRQAQEAGDAVVIETWAPRVLVELGGRGVYGDGRRRGASGWRRWEIRARWCLSDAPARTKNWTRSPVESQVPMDDNSSEPYDVDAGASEQSPKRLLSPRPGLCRACEDGEWDPGGNGRRVVLL